MKFGPAYADALARIRTYPERPVHRVIGLMTGTSADAVDAAMVRFDHAGGETRHTLEAFRETPLEAELRAEILEVAAGGQVSLERVMRLDAAIGECYAAAVLELIAFAGRAPDEVDAIGAHGQTVRHIPRHTGGGQALTLQLGSADILAERTGIAVVSGFRGRDTAAGGEGAPLVPIVDWALFRSDTESRALLNLGGIANVTHLPRGGGPADVLAFDTGPANSVIDGLVHLATDGDERRDTDGVRARRGRVNDVLLEELLTDPYFAVPPPRSTGREHFGDAYAATLRKIGAGLKLSDDDMIATAVELTAASIEMAFRRFLEPRGGVDAVYASGGGTRNPALMDAIAARLVPAPIRSTETIGVHPDAKEAVAFAYLGHRTLLGAPGNVPSATGAVHPVVLGHITPGVA